VQNDLLPALIEQAVYLVLEHLVAFAQLHAAFDVQDHHVTDRSFVDLHENAPDVRARALRTDDFATMSFAARVLSSARSGPDEPPPGNGTQFARRADAVHANCDGGFERGGTAGATGRLQPPPTLDTA